MILNSKTYKCGLKGKYRYKYVPWFDRIITFLQGQNRIIQLRNFLHFLHSFHFFRNVIISPGNFRPSLHMLEIILPGVEMKFTRPPRSPDISLQFQQIHQIAIIEQLDRFGDRTNVPNSNKVCNIIVNARNQNFHFITNKLLQYQNFRNANDTMLWCLTNTLTVPFSHISTIKSTFNLYIIFLSYYYLLKLFGHH